MNAYLDNPAIRDSGQQGFSMVEVLVALVVLCVGMLGIASLYVVTLQSSGSAISRTQAVNLASDLGDRIRANRNVPDSYTFDGTGTLTDQSCVGSSASCSPAQMAAHDLFIWKQQIESTLPGSPTGTVALDESTVPRTYLITVSWTEPSQPDRLSYEMRLQI
jgi:type IV pilus assembly protein PilV